ncbi:29514_t:CDS:2, partial [Racocetra persica]
AMEKFDLNTKFRFATYAGCWVRQYIQSCINKEQFINQGGVKDKKNVVYYDSGYQNDDQESKSYSLQETLHDEQNNELTAEELRRQDVLIQTNNLINTLGNREAILLNRLLYKIKPSSLVDIYYLADEKEKKELQENLKLSKKFNLEQLKKRPLEGPTIRNLPVVKKYLSLFTKNYKFIEISRILGKSENTTQVNKKPIEIVYELKEQDNYQNEDESVCQNEDLKVHNFTTSAKRSVGLGEAGMGVGGYTARYSANVDVANARVGAVRANIGIDVGSGVTAGVDGIEAKVAGVGFSLGKKTGISTPFGGISVDFDDCAATADDLLGLGGEEID